ncbi:hypothetical protein AGDE_10112 [Angomonas deanei]|uniref:Uncharacterized protein n=1 Tax=Angomonas deanei TaxID=59799 RepID=A0A7G2CQ83_9TRYP|nr:hypothetical protein AGDE_10112 [Angomonas deanei]CAD2220352.1 hypothetical protein, conserved [Angomonas deanei]|eukprot:EPY29127.1 hypothetical protein AGDE_10112 [Angomonas deanei]
MPLSLWQQLEREALQRVPNQEGTRYLEVDEMVRDAVCRLFVQSNYDVRTLLTNVTSSLQHIGRYDIGLMRNDNNTAFTVTQSSAFGGREADPSIDEIERRRRIIATSIERINRSGADGRDAFNKAYQDALNAVPQLPSLQENVNVPASNDPFRKSAYEELMEVISKQKAEKRQAAQQSPPPAQRPVGPSSHMGNALPTSNGNYLLQRYGGNYPDANYYQNYRYYGVKK